MQTSCFQNVVGAYDKIKSYILTFFNWFSHNVRPIYIGLNTTFGYYFSIEFITPPYVQEDDVLLFVVCLSQSLKANNKAHWTDRDVGFRKSLLKNKSVKQCY